MFRIYLARSSLSLLRRARRVGLGGGCVAALLLLAAVAGRAEGTAPAPGTITSISSFWELNDAEKQKPHPVRLELIVYYYDAAWSVLYGEVDGSPSYLPVRGRALPIKSGQKVLLEGTVVPAEGLDNDYVKVTVLAEGLLPEPTRTAGRLQDFASLHGRWAEIEGYVLSQHEPDPTHIEAKLLSDNQLIDLTILINATDPVPLLTGARIRVVGVYDSVADAVGRPQQVQCWTTERVQILGWLADDERFKLEPTPIDRLDTAGQPWVHLTGEVWSQEPGQSLTLRDGTGQITFATVQPENLPARANVDVVGRPVRDEFGWTLQDPLFRRVDSKRAAHPEGKASQRLRLAEQVSRLSPEEANLQQSVTLRGVITWFDDRAPYFYLQDASGGVRVRREPGIGGGLTPGASIMLSGVTRRGELMPEVALREFTTIGPLGQPPARGITLDQALSGVEESQRVEMRGYVREVKTEEPWTRLELTAPTGEFAALLPADGSLDYLQGAIVRVRGVCTVASGARREASEVELWLQSLAAVIVDEPPVREPFALPRQTTASLRRFSSTQGVNKRVHVSGAVLRHDAGRSLYLQDEEGGLLILSRNTPALAPGTWIDVVGIPGREGNRAALREGVWRIGAPPGRAIVPRDIPVPQLLDPAIDIQLVRVAAVLRQVVRDGNRLRLRLEAEGTAFVAILPAPVEWAPPAVGSRLQLTGINVLEFDDYRRLRASRLELRTPADVVVLVAPPWWTVERTLYVAGILATVVAGISLWVIALRRRVHRQMEQIRAQMTKEGQLRADVERAARLESLGVLAGGIAHDFNNLLTAILGNLGLAAMDKRVMEAAGDCISEAERGARRARDITHQLLTFAKGGEPVRSAVLLPEIVTEAANFARQGTQVRFDIKCPPDLPAGDVDAGQISRVVHNLVLNAVQAMPDEGGVVGITLTAEDLSAGAVGTLAPGRYIRLTVTDTGSGISPEIMPRIFDPYFSTKSKGRNSGLGLATVRSIVVKHNGHIEAESTPGAGATFRVWLPAAREEAPAPTKLVRSAALEPARVLVMDDEAVIRRVAGRMLALAGHETVFALDGAEAVQAYVTAKQSGRPFDFVILDLTVAGGMGGKEAVAELLKIDPDVRAIASSGYSSDPVMANPGVYGFRSRLPKPYDIPDLMRAIEEARGT